MLYQQMQGSLDIEKHDLVEPTSEANACKSEPTNIDLERMYSISWWVDVGRSRSLEIGEFRVTRADSGVAQQRVSVPSVSGQQAPPPLLSPPKKLLSTPTKRLSSQPSPIN